MTSIAPKLVCICVALLVTISGCAPAIADAKSEKLAEELFHQATIAKENNQIDLAISLLERVIKIAPNSFQNAYLNLALLYQLEKHNPQRAARLLQKAIELDPTDFRYRWQYALTLIDQQKFVLARRVLLNAQGMRKTPKEQQNFDRRLSELNRYLSPKK